MVKKQTFISAHSAALAGLSPAVRGDQALHLGAPQGLKRVVWQTEINAVVHKLDEGRHVGLLLAGSNINHSLHGADACRQCAAIEAIKVLKQFRGFDTLFQADMKGGVRVAVRKFEAHGSGLNPSLHAQNIPCHIGPQVLATHCALGGLLNGWTIFGRNRFHALPMGNRSFLEAEQLGELFLAPQDVSRSFDGL